MFTLHERLRQDTVEVASLRLSLVLLMDDSSFPWLVLVPRRGSVREVHELSAGDRAVLIEEVAAASRVVERLYRPHKINIGALGNLVPQLHIHVVGRYGGDRAWPGPVWGSGAPVPYGHRELQDRAASLKAAFEEEPPF